MTSSEHHNEKIAAQIPTRTFGKHVFYFKEITSTNSYLKKILNDDVPEGTLVTAEMQTAGRGRFNRRWVAPARSSLLTSLLFRPTFLSAQKAQYLTMLCALAMVDAIAEKTDIQVGIKWPNDLMGGGKKLAGMLTEISIIGEQLEWVIVGFGLNVNIDFTAMDDVKTHAGQRLSESATSLQNLSTRPIARAPLLPAYLLNVENRYEALKRGVSPLDEWRARLVNLGKRVNVSTADGIVSGFAEDVTALGALRLRMDDGQIREILAGDVNLSANN